MKHFLPIFALALCGFAGTTLADDFRSEVITTMPLTIRVHGDQFMVIRNFTQDGGTTRGFVTLGTPPTFAPTVNVLTAAILNPMNTIQGSLEVINSIVIAGPANVTFTCGTGGGTCFVSFKKDSN